MFIPRKQYSLFSLSTKGCFELTRARVPPPTAPQVIPDKSLWSQCCLGEKHKAQIQEEIFSGFTKGLNQEPVLKSDVFGKPLKTEGNDNCTIAQPQ